MLVVLHAAADWNPNAQLLKVREPRVVTFLNSIRIVFELHMPRFVVKNGHWQATCSNEIQLLYVLKMWTPLWAQQ